MYLGIPTVALLLACFFNVQVFAEKPKTFSLFQRYPDKDEVSVCGNIRDIITRDSGRYRKILVRNSNSEVVYLNEDCRRMTSRTKSKLDVLAANVRNKWKGVSLKVILAWTDQKIKSDPTSLHYEAFDTDKDSLFFTANVVTLLL